MIPWLLKAAHTVTFLEWSGCWRTLSGLLLPQNTQCVLFTLPDKWKWLSSLNQTLSSQPGSVLILWRKTSHISWRRTQSRSVSLWRIEIVYGKRLRSLRRILQAEVRLTGTAVAKRRRRIDISPSSSTDAARMATFSFDRAFLALPDLPKFCFFTEPVFRNLSVHS